jgi:hypothetical protein
MTECTERSTAARACQRRPGMTECTERSEGMS